MSEYLYQPGEEDIPFPMSSFSLAIRKSPRSAKADILATYELKNKFQSIANIADPDQKYKTMFWWQQQILDLRNPQYTPQHPALLQLLPMIREFELYDWLIEWMNTFNDWLDIRRVNSIAELNPLLEKLAVRPFKIWFILCAKAFGIPNLTIQSYLVNPSVMNLIESAAKQIWWIDQFRHLGHQLNSSRIWVPIEMLKNANIPAHLLLQWSSESPQKFLSLTPLALEFNAVIATEAEKFKHAWFQCKNHLSAEQWKEVQKSSKGFLHLLRLRQALLQVMMESPDDIFIGLVSLGNFKKLMPPSIKPTKKDYKLFMELSNS